MGSWTGVRFSIHVVHFEHLKCPLLRLRVAPADLSLLSVSTGTLSSESSSSSPGKDTSSASSSLKCSSAAAFTSTFLASAKVSEIPAPRQLDQETSGCVIAISRLPEDAEFVMAVLFPLEKRSWETNSAC